MPDTQDGRVRVPIKGETVLRLTPVAELLLRVQCLERAIACSPFCYNTYNKELERVGLKKLDLRITAWPLVA